MTGGSAANAQDDAAFCPRCGQVRSATAGDTHAACEAALRLEPPRYCEQCGRRMTVQVTPAGWTARCVEHGVLATR